MIDSVDMLLKFNKEILSTHTLHHFVLGDIAPGEQHKGLVVILISLDQALSE